MKAREVVVVVVSRKRDNGKKIGQEIGNKSNKRGREKNKFPLYPISGRRIKINKKREK